MHSTGTSCDGPRHLGRLVSCTVCEFRVRLIQGLRPQVEVYGLMASKDDWGCELVRRVCLISSTDLLVWCLYTEQSIFSVHNH